MKELVTSSALLILLLASCFSKEMKNSGKTSDIPADKKDYVGNWTSDSMTLEISAQGNVDYARSKGNGNTSVSAPIQEFKGDDFEAGLFGFNTRFDVSEKPHKEGGVWKMTVDGVELTRQ